MPDSDKFCAETGRNCLYGNVVHALEPEKKRKEKCT